MSNTTHVDGLLQPCPEKRGGAMTTMFPFLRSVQ